MKKLIALLLVAVFAVSMVACGGVGVSGHESPEAAMRTTCCAIYENFDAVEFLNHTFPLNYQRLNIDLNPEMKNKITDWEEQMFESEKYMRDENPHIEIVAVFCNYDKTYRSNDDEYINLAERYEEYGLDNFDELVDEIVPVTAIWTEDGELNRYSEFSDTHYALKINGKWYISYLD